MLACSCETETLRIEVGQLSDSTVRLEAVFVLRVGVEFVFETGAYEVGAMYGTTCELLVMLVLPLES